jgi:agmatinase
MGIFGLNYDQNNSNLVIIPISWDATSSYKRSSAESPSKIIKPSYQIDLQDPDFGFFADKGICLLPSDRSIKKLNKESSILIDYIRERENISKKDKIILDLINENSNSVYDISYNLAKSYLNKEKKTAFLGGDHSCALGLIKALSQIYDNYSILQFDAHLDLRDAYQGLKYSHASVIYNAIKNFKQIKKIINIGARDYSQEEFNLSKKLGDKYSLFTSSYIFSKIADGINYNNIFDKIINSIKTKNIYISFDIDCLEQNFCPNTGTPVPGGLSFNQISYFLKKIKDHNFNIIGFDLSEIGNSEWDLNIGMRILFKLSALII